MTAFLYLPEPFNIIVAGFIAIILLYILGVIMYKEIKSRKQISENSRSISD